ncbi:MAG: molybdopterin dinucleotide binding domain-containing protein, partial [Anaerolineaceae bacterium]
DYPFYLTTGRVVYHFHTRTKTARSADLEKAAPEAFIQIAEEDAREAGLVEGDWLEVSTRRGSVTAPVRVGDILKGHLFIPFHYGYWDRDNGHTRAANELTITGFDPVSKQPHFKFAAAKIRKISREG